MEFTIIVSTELKPGCVMPGPAALGSRIFDVLAGVSGSDPEWPVRITAMTTEQYKTRETP